MNEILQPLVSLSDLQKPNDTGLHEPFKYEAQTALFKDPVRTAQ